MTREASLNAAVRVCTFLVRERTLIACLVLNDWPLLNLKRVARNLVYCCDEGMKKCEYT